MKTKTIIAKLMIAAVMLALFCAPPVYADNGDKDKTDTVIDIGINGDVQVDISASGPAELNVKAEGPTQVSIDAGDKVNLNVKASDESQILIEGEDIDEPARQQETEYTNQVNSGSLQLNNPIVSSGNHVTIMLAASAIAVGLAAFFLIGHFIYRKRSERKIK